MADQSLGFVEVMGLVAAIECADAMVKAARVNVKTIANADAGLLSVVCEGELSACGAAVDAGKAVTQRMGNYLGSNLTPRPSTDTEGMVENRLPGVFPKKEAKAAAPKAKAPKAAKKK